MRVLVITGAIAALAAAGGYYFYQFGKIAVHGLSGPAIGHGNRTEAIDEMALGAEIPGFDGYNMRARYIVVAPGGLIRIHNHSGRPAFSYIVAEPVTQVRSDDQTPIKMGPGDLSADNGIAHYWTNDGTGEARWYVVDIYQTSGNKGE